MRELQREAIRTRRAITHSLAPCLEDRVRVVRTTLTD